MRSSDKTAIIFTGSYFLIANLFFAQGSDLLFYSLLLITFPFGPLCMDALRHLDVSILANYEDDARNAIWHILSYVILVIGGALWYGFLVRLICWIWVKVRGRK